MHANCHIPSSSTTAIGGESGGVHHPVDHVTWLLFSATSLDKHCSYDVRGQRNASRYRKAGLSTGRAPSRASPIPKTRRSGGDRRRRDRQDPRSVVYGSFDGSGRFCRRVCYSWDCTEPVGFVPIADEDVEYDSRFQGMTSLQVRAAVYGYLQRQYSPSLDAGEE